MPIGGIGTGTVSLGGHGDLRDWEIGNRPAKGFRPDFGFFAVHVDSGDGHPVTRALESRLDHADYAGPQGSAAANHGLPRFRHGGFHAAYPLGQVGLSDPDVPVSIVLQAFNPLIPGDAERSGIPVAVLRYVVTNDGDRPVRVSVCGSVSGSEVSYREACGWVGLSLRGEVPGEGHERHGTLALATTAGDVSHRTRWADRSWGGELLDFWEDFSADGQVADPDTPWSRPVGSLANRVEIAPGAMETVTFLLGWHFPNRRAWAMSQGSPFGEYTDDIVGNHYATRFTDAWHVVGDVARDLPALERETVRFVDAFCSSDLPSPVQEAALFNLSTLRTQTCFRTEDGRFFGWEGCHDDCGSCFGSCTHVWNYEQATAHLFGSLSRSMRTVEFGHATDERGLMSFRVGLPLAERARDWGLAAADGQLGCLVKLYRDWKLSGDEDLLARLWPKARAALAFAWIDGGWDADKDGVMEGCQHNTMDVEYYGPNPQIQGWYLAALRAGEELSRHLGEDDFAERCRDLFELGSRWTDEHLFNGEYYEQQIRPASDGTAIAEGLRYDQGGEEDLADPPLQIGSGCLTDQLVGQFLAHTAGLGHLLDPEHLRTTLRSILRHNWRGDFHRHFSNMRSFALGDESGLLLCSYPHGDRPRRPFPYFNEVWTGMEYTVAAGLCYEGMTDEGVRVMAAARERFDGRRRNPFDEAECGHHYVRAMAGWGAVLALTGFGYDAHTATLRLRPRAGAVDFFSTGDGYGVARQQRANEQWSVQVEILGGTIAIDTVELGRTVTCTASPGLSGPGIGSFRQRT